MAQNTQQIYKTNKHSADELIAFADSYLTSVNMETQTIEDTRGKKTLLQARVTGGSWKQIFGLDKCLTLGFDWSDHNYVKVEIGGQKWADKAATATISLFVLWPLAVTSIIGFSGQKSLIKNIIKEMDSFMAN